jgi:hypothetical protein
VGNNQIVRVVLSDDVMDAVQDANDANEAFAPMNVATDYYIEQDKPMPLDEALKVIKREAAKIEARE